MKKKKRKTIKRRTKEKIQCNTKQENIAIYLSYYGITGLPPKLHVNYHQKSKFWYSVIM